MKRSFLIFLCLVFLFASGGLSLAWSGPGHMLVAALAYRDLSVDERRTVSELLKHHPDYAKWINSFSSELAPVDLETFVFMRASTWPDEIRRKGNPYDHPQWHYVDYPLEAPNFPEKPGPFTDNDILYGIAQSEKQIQSHDAPPEIRAVYLSWLIHLVGDIHQPLHCCTLVNETYPAPTGDKGGNGFFVKPNTAGVNLHSVWDKALGSTANPRTQYTYAIQLAAERPRTKLPELARDKTPESWSKESRMIAIEIGYLHGSLKGSTTAANAPALPDDYTKNLKVISERQAALAGFRLADEIKQYVH